MALPKPSQGQICCTIDRRQFLHTISGIGATGTLTSLAHAKPDNQKFPFQVGASVAEIPTPLDVGLLMSSGRQLWEPFDNIRLPICARTVVIERQTQRLAIVSLDLLGLAGEAVGGMNRFKQQITKASGSLIQPDTLILASTHTHTSPESAALTDLYRTPAFQTWCETLAQQIARSVREATATAQPCRLTTGTHLTSNMVLNRRIRTTKGIRSVRQQIPPDERIGPKGPADEHVRVAAFIDRQDKPRAILVNFAAHPVIEMCIKQLSPDYPGEMCLELQRRHPGAAPLFLQGACGNLNPPKVATSAEDAQQYGRQLADAVDTALKASSPDNGNQLAVHRRSVHLPLREDDSKQEVKTLETKIAAARIGNAAFVFLPGEPFIELAIAIRQSSPFPFTAVMGYSEDYIGYIPTDRAFENGGYETRPGRWSRLAPGSQAIVCNQATQLLESF